jgi:hypothetical protein
MHITGNAAIEVGELDRCTDEQLGGDLCNFFLSVVIVMLHKGRLTQISKTVRQLA